MAGIFVQTVAFGSVGTGIGLAEDLHKGIIDRFRSLPMARSAVLVGRTLSDLLRNGISVAAMLIVGLLVGFRPDDTWWAYLAAAGLLMIFSFAFSWISAVIGLSVKTVEAAQSGGFIWLFPLTFCSTAFVPLDQLPSWLQGFAEYQPVSVTVTAVRGLTMDSPIGNSAWLSLAWSVGILAVFVPLAVRTDRRAAAR